MMKTSQDFLADLNNGKRVVVYRKRTGHPIWFSCCYSKCGEQIYHSAPDGSITACSEADFQSQAMKHGTRVHGDLITLESK